MENKPVNKIFKSDGRYWGFIKDDFLYSRDGLYMGWLEGKFVWDRKGFFRGVLTPIIGMSDAYYVLLNKFSIPTTQRTPKETGNVSPLDPLPSIKSIVLPTGVIDGF